MGGETSAGASSPLGLIGAQLLLAQSLSCLLFCVLNVALNQYNAWLVKTQYIAVNTTVINGDNTTSMVLSQESPDHPIGGSPNIHWQVFYTMWHMIASVLGASVLLVTVVKPSDGFPTFAKFWQYKHVLLPLAVCNVGSIACNNVSLAYISLFVNQVIKACVPLPTMIFTVLLEGKTYGWDMILSCIGIVGFCILALPSSSGTNTAGGYVLVIVSGLCAAAKPVIMGLMMKDGKLPKLPPTVVLFYDSAISGVGMLIYFLASSERSGVAAYFSGNAVYAIGLISAGASMAFMFNLSNYFFILLTSALTTTVASNGVKIVNITISAFQGQALEARNWAGVMLVCVSILLYAYCSYAAKQKPPAGAAFKLPLFTKKDTETDAPGAYVGGRLVNATEGTPLKTDAPVGGNSCCVVS